MFLSSHFKEQLFQIYREIMTVQPFGGGAAGRGVWSCIQRIWMVICCHRALASVAISGRKWHDAKLDAKHQ